jgi:catechol 2,3-dioxygenase-like lactoylglutathione lyase family enzyme
VISHVSIEVSDLERSAAFYDALLGPLGWRRVAKAEGSIGYGLYDDPSLIVFAGSGGAAGRGPQVCLAAAGIPAVKAAWGAGVAAGGRSEGEPGPRPHYRPGYYSAYLRDPDGYRLEVAVRAE